MAGGLGDYAKNSPLVAALLPRRNTYFEALGNFIHQFALTESFVLLLHRVKSGVSEEVGKALFQGVKADAAIDNLRRLASAQSVPLKPKLDSALSQFRVLSDTRNDIVHFGAKLEDAYVGKVTNASRILKQGGNVRTLDISPEMLNDMTLDCLRIRAHFMAEMSDTAKVSLSGLLDGAWLYTPPPSQRSAEKISAQKGLRSKREKKAQRKALVKSLQW